jgi:hypothetical protein
LPSPSAFQPTAKASADLGVRIQIKEIRYAQSINHNHQSKGTIS